MTPVYLIPLLNIYTGWIATSRTYNNTQLDDVERYLLAHNVITPSGTPTHFEWEHRWEVTERGKIYLEHIIKVPLPVPYTHWVIPSPPK